MDFIQFLALMDEVKLTKTYYLRWGQTLMNVLYRTYPELYDQITGTDFDCFYLDENLGSVVSFLLDNSPE